MQIRPWHLAAGFSLLFAAIASLAWMTGLGTVGPWFSSSLSSTMYAIAIVAGSFLALIVTREASDEVARLDARLRRLDRAIFRFRAAARPPAPPVAREGDVDADLDSLGLGASPSAAGSERAGHDTLVEVTPLLPAAFSVRQTSVLRELVRARVALRESRADVWRSAAAPVVVAILYVLIGGIMLPGSEGFASAHYQLNTALVLFLGYGFAPLVGWAVIVLALPGRVRGLRGHG